MCVCVCVCAGVRAVAPRAVTRGVAAAAAATGAPEAAAALLLSGIQALQHRGVVIMLNLVRACARGRRGPVVMVVCLVPFCCRPGHEMALRRCCGR